MHLYIKSTLSFRKVAEEIARRILIGFELEERDGLNLGGGDYFCFSRDDTKVLLVANDADHAEVFEPSRQEFPYYCYVRRGSQDILGRMLAALPNAGLDGELAE